VHALRTFSFSRLWHLTVESGGGRSYAGAEGEDVGVGKAHLFDEAQALFKVGLGFAGKTDYHVGSNDQVRDGCAGVGDQLAEARHSAAAGHTAQLGVRSGLQRQMQMGAETSRPALPKVEEAVGQLPWFQTAEAQAGDVGVGEDGRGQLLEIGPLAPGKVPAKGTEMDTGEHGFAVAVPDECLDFLHYIGSGAAAAVAAQGGDDAECTAVLAAVLDFDEGACASAVLIRGRGVEGGTVRLNAGEIFGIGKLCAPGLEERMQHLLGLVVGDQLDAGESGALPGSEGGVTAGQGDAGIGVALVEVSGGLAALACGLGCNGAGVEYDHVGVFGPADDAMTGSAEAACKCAVFAEVEPATQLVEKYAHSMLLVAGCQRLPSCVATGRR